MSEQSTLFIDNAPFLGRVEEQQRFRDALRQVIQDNSVTAKAKRLVVDQDLPLPFVFLLYGEGGMGKSTLAKQLRHITTTETEFKGHFETLWLDWEARKQLDLKLVARESVSPETVFEHIYAIFRDAGFGKEFDSYEDALKTRAKAEQNVAKALDTTIGEGRDRYAALRELGGKGLAWLLRTGLPGGVNLPQEPTAKAFEAIIGGGAEGLARARDAATTLLRSRLEPDEFDLFTLPNETLARTLADGLWKSSQKKPLLFTLDTYEIANRADVWLRFVIKRAGPNVIWIIAGRDNLAESRKYGQNYQPGYRADFTSDRLRVFSMDEFSVSDVAEYFKYRVPERPLDEATARAIHQAALGIPLAVKEAAAIWQNPATTLSDITGDGTPSRNRDKIVQTMTQRFFMHCWDDPHDRQRLYALALAYQPDADLLSAMLDTADLEAELSELERRHSFVFVDDMKLHDKVSVWIREYSQAEVRRKGKDVRDLHQRAVNHLHERLTRIEAEVILIEDRCDDDSWVMATVGLAYHLFWLDENEAWHWFIPRFVEGSAYSYDLTDGLLGVAHDCRACLTPNGKKRLEVLLSGNEPARPEDEKMLIDELMQLATKDWFQGKGEAERSAILDLRLGQLLYNRKQFVDALACYERATRGLPDNGENLKGQLAQAFRDVGWELGWERGFALPSVKAKLALKEAVHLCPEEGVYWVGLGVMKYGSQEYVEAVETIKHGIELSEDKAWAHNWLGNVYFDLGHTDDAIAAYQRAIELDPKDATPHNGLGNVYFDLGHTNDAITAYQRAIELDPKDATPHNGLGNVYSSLDYTDDAIAAYQHTIELDPKFATPHYGLGNVYFDLSRTDDAIAAYQRAIELDPKLVAPHYGLGNVYSNLGHTDDAIAAYQRAIELDPKLATARVSIVACYHKLGRKAEAAEQEKIARELIAKENEYNRACFEAICGNADEALALLKVAFEKKQVSLAWTRRDPDFESLRTDPRFIALVGAADERPSTDS